jgi:hypothetical protein
MYKAQNERGVSQSVRSVTWGSVYLGPSATNQWQPGTCVHQFHLSPPLSNKGATNKPSHFQ